MNNTTKTFLLVAACVMASMASTHLYLGVAKPLYDERTREAIREEMSDRLTANRFFEPGDGNLFYMEDLEFRPVEDFRYSLVTDLDELVIGIHVTFPEGLDCCHATISTPYNPRRVVTFRRGSGIGLFEYGARMVPLTD